MLRRMLMVALLCLAAYVIWIQVQVLSQKGIFKLPGMVKQQEETQKVYFFSFTKFRKP